MQKVDQLILTYEQFCIIYKYFPFDIRYASVKQLRTMLMYDTCLDKIPDVILFLLQYNDSYVELINTEGYQNIRLEIWEP